MLMAPPGTTAWPGGGQRLIRKISHSIAFSGTPICLRGFLKKNFLIQDVSIGLSKMSYLGNTGWRSNRASTACIAAFPSAMPFW